MLSYQFSNTYICKTTSLKLSVKVSYENLFCGKWGFLWKSFAASSINHFYAPLTENVAVRMRLFWVFPNNILTSWGALHGAFRIEQPRQVWNNASYLAAHIKLKISMEDLGVFISGKYWLKLLFARLPKTRIQLAISTAPKKLDCIFWLDQFH